MKGKDIHKGDMVERIAGIYVGLRGKVIACKPRMAPWTTHIKVKVDLDQFTGKYRKRVWLLTTQWSSVASWSKIR